MRSRPISLTFYSWMMILIACSFPLQTALMYQVPAYKFYMAFSYLSWINLVVIAGCLLCAHAARRADPGCYWMAAVMAVLVVFNNVWVGQHGQDFGFSELVLASLGFVLIQFTLGEPEANKVLSEPALRWWLRSPRVPVNLEVRVIPRTGEVLQLSTFDVSETGLYVDLAERLDNISQFETGDRVDLVLNLGVFRQIKCTGQLVRKSESTKGIYPPGLGLCFDELDRQARKALRSRLNMSPVPAMSM